MNDSLVIQNIMIENDLSQTDLANMIGVQKQIISYIVNGKRKLTTQQKEKLNELFPDIHFENDIIESRKWLVDLRKSYGYTQQEFADRLCISQALYGKLETGERKITSNVLQRIKMFERNDTPTSVTISYCPEVFIPFSTSFNSNDTILLDKRLFIDGEDTYNPSSCYVVTLTSDALFPEFREGDRVIIDTSQKRFKMNGYYMFKTPNNIHYVRKIILLPDKIKCTSTGNSEDTFYLPDTKGADVIGRILPKIRV